MAATGHLPGPLRRWQAFAGERLAGAPGGQPDVADVVELGDRVMGLAPHLTRGAPGEPREPGEAGGAAQRLALDHRDALLALHRRRLAADAGAPASRAAAVPAPGRNWVPLGPAAIRRGQAEGEPVVSGRLQEVCVSADAQRVYVASANGGVWRSADAGRTWESTMDGVDVDPVATVSQATTLACGALVLVEGISQASDTLVLATGEGTSALDDFRGTGIWFSGDGGTTWAPEPATPQPTPGVDALLGHGCLALAVDPQDATHLVVASSRGLFRRSVVGGVATWTREVVPAGAGLPSSTARFTGVAMAVRGGSTVTVAVTGTGLPIMSTRAGGADSPWAVLGTGFPTASMGRCTIAAAPSVPDVFYVLAAQPNGVLHGLYRLDLAQAGTPWRQVTGVPPELFGESANKQGWYDQAIAVLPDDATVVFLGGSASGGGASVYRCAVTVAAAGVSCSAHNVGGRVHPDVHALSFRPGTHELWVGCDGGAFVTADALGGPELFQARNTGLGVVTLQSVAHAGEYFAFGGVQDNGGCRWTGSEVWDHQLPGDGGATLIHAGSQDRLLNGYTNATMRRAKTDGGRYTSDYVNVPVVANEQVAFYPPMEASRTTPNLVALGAQRPWVSTSFGGGWTALPLPGTHVIAATPPPVNNPTVRSLAFATDTRILGGYTTGELWRWDLVGGTWQAAVRLDGTLPVPFVVPITSIAIDPANANRFWLTLGGQTGLARVWQGTIDAAGNVPAASWVPLPGAGANVLLNTQHNTIVADPSTPGTLFVGADVGVWRTTDTGANWTAFSPNLPDAPVFDLDLVTVPPDPPAGGGPVAAPLGLLRASTHGRGLFEIPLDLANAAPQPAVELYLRANEVDQRRRNAQTGIPIPSALARTSGLRASPDIRVDPPGAGGRFAVDATQAVDLVRLEDTCTGTTVVLSTPDAVRTTQVHAVVRNRGVERAETATATLLVGRIPKPAAGATPAIPDLPAGWAGDVVAGTTVDAGGWKTASTRPVPPVVAGRPAVVTFGLTSDTLPPLGDADGVTYALLVVLHHAADPLPADAPVVVDDLVRTQRRTALNVVTGASFPGGPLSGSPGGTGLVVPVSTVLLTHHRLGQLVTALEAKAAAAAAPPVGAAPSVVRDTERRVLALAKAAQGHLQGGAAAPVPAGRPGAGIGSAALLGALGYEVPGYTGLLAPGGAWTATALRRGSADPDTSLVKVVTTELPVEVARRAVAALGADAGKTATVRAFSSGMLTAAAAGLTVGPLLADLLAEQTHRDWARHTPSIGAAAVEDALRSRLLQSGDGSPASLASWLPAASSVPGELWDALAAVVNQTVGTGDARTKGFAAFESTFSPGDALTGTRLRNAYGLLLHDLTTGSWPAVAWWFLLLPLAMSPPISLLVARESEHGKQFFTGGASVDAKGLLEVLMAGQAVAAVPTFVYSMILWGLVDEHTEPFVNAMLFGLLRGALTTATFATASDADISDTARWLGYFLPLQAVDVYSGIRAAVGKAQGRPGDAFVFGFNTFPSMNAWLTTGTAAALKAAGISHTDAGFWAPWTVLTAGLLGAAIPISIALADGGGYRSWFLRDNPGLPVLSATRRVAEPQTEPAARARVVSIDELWIPFGATDEAQFRRYPEGMRPLVAVWFEGSGDLEVKHTAAEVVLRVGGAETSVPVEAATATTELAAALGAVDGVKTEVLGVADASLPLGSPALADPGDPLDLPDLTTAETRFVPAGRTRKEAVVLRHAPFAEQTFPMGLPGSVLDPFPVVPQMVDLSDLTATGLGLAADLGVLLNLAAAPSLATVRVADALPALADPALREVAQVFRRWNLDHRRVDEWRQLVFGDAVGDPVDAGEADPMIREVAAAVAGHPHPAGAPVALSMGWLRLWRAWLAVASDPLADTTAAVAGADTPVVTMPDGQRRPTNAELTDGIRFLLDLGDPPP